MNFAGVLRRIRKEKGLSQQELADIIFVHRSTIASWESGRRMPDAAMIKRLSDCLDIDASLLMNNTSRTGAKPIVILVDDEKIVMRGGMAVLKAALPGAEIEGFSSATSTLEFAENNNVALAFLDIELGQKSGLELCTKLLEINPRTNVVFLTAYMDYAYRAWETGASGFMTKPVTLEGVLKQLELLRYPVPGLH